VRRSAEQLELDAFIRVDQAALSLALSAVVEDEDGALSYWALKHRPASRISTTPMRSPWNSMKFGIDRLLEDARCETAGGPPRGRCSRIPRP